MTIAEYIEKAFKIGILYDEDAERWYVDPWWEVHMIYDNEKYDFFDKIDMWKIMDHECIRRNNKYNKKDYVFNFIYNLLHEKIEPYSEDKIKEITNLLLKKDIETSK